MSEDKKKEIDKFEPDYLVTLDEIYHSHWAARKAGRLRILKDAFNYFWPAGHPSRLIHVTGTNGKGSVIFYLEQGLLQYGNTGSWNGPHLFDYAERFHINGEQASHSDIVRIYRNLIVPYQKKLVNSGSPESLSFAEIGILIALHLFQENKVAWGMMEVGAGGRYTPLMALEMDACVLTNVGTDHTKSLGTELWQRILEKSGIARKGIPFFTSVGREILPYVEKSAAVEEAKFFPLSDQEISSLKKGAANQPEFKIRNLALAVKIIKFFYPDFIFNREKMSRDLIGRFWYVEPNIIADVSHNTDKITQLASYLKLKYPGKKFRFILGLSRKRNARKVFAPLLSLARHIVVTSASYAGRPPSEVCHELKGEFTGVEIIDDPKEAFIREKSRLAGNEILVLTGSAYMIDQALNPNPFLKHLNATYGRRYL